MAKGALRRDETSFGFRDVGIAEKQGLVDYLAAIHPTS